VYRRVLLRDLRCGASDGSAEKTWPGLIPKFAVMLATSYSEKALTKIVYPAYAQLKSDGARSEAIIDVDAGVCTFYSRNGKEMFLSPRSGKFLIDALKGAGYKGKWVLDGEMVFMTDTGVADRSTGNGIVNKAVKGTLEWEEEKNLHFDVWDIVSYEEFQAGKGKEPYTVRLERLNKLEPNSFWSVIPTHIVNSLAEAKTVYGKYIAEGLEGIILKNMAMIWEDARSKDQVKFKQELQADLEVVEVLPGKKGKKYEAICGSVTMVTRCRKLTVNVAGMSDDLRKWFWENRDKVPGTIWQSTYNGIVKARGSDVYKLFLPRLDHQRLDKNEANSLEELQEAATEASI
jgi:ATP-dependent DNA ligase